MNRKASALATTAALAGFAGSADGRVTSLPVPLADTGLQVVGSGEFRFLGFHLYDARLWRDEQGRQALEIVYRKNISGHRLTATMLDEWQRLRPAAPDRLERWARETGDFWPDVTPGASLIALVDDERTRFFDGSGAQIGQIDEPEFGPAFLDIWLHPDSRAGKLRRALLGQR